MCSIMLIKMCIVYIVDAQFDRSVVKTAWHQIMVVFVYLQCMGKLHILLPFPKMMYSMSYDANMYVCMYVSVH